MFSGSGGLGYLLVLLLPFLLLVFIMVSQRRRAQQIQALQDSLAVGEEIVTTSGPLRHDRRPRRHGGHARHRGRAARCATTGGPSACAPPRWPDMAAATAADRRPPVPPVLLALVVVLVGLLAGAVYLVRREDRAPSSASTSRAAPRSSSSRRPTPARRVSAEQLNQARDIIVQRVDAGGVSGAEVTTQGDRNIVVSIPEIPTQEVRDAISKSSQLQFRPVLAVAAGVPQCPSQPVAERHGPGRSPSPSRDPDRRRAAPPRRATAPSPRP